jgi:hypothetical protein
VGNYKEEVPNAPKLETDLRIPGRPGKIDRFGMAMRHTLSLRDAKMCAFCASSPPPNSQERLQTPNSYDLPDTILPKPISCNLRVADAFVESTV